MEKEDKLQTEIKKLETIINLLDSSDNSIQLGIALLLDSVLEGLKKI